MYYIKWIAIGFILIALIAGSAIKVYFVERTKIETIKACFAAKQYNCDKIWK